MAKSRIMRVFRLSLEKNFSLNINKLFNVYSPSFLQMRCSSSVLEGGRTYELGNFEADLKPFLKTRKKVRIRPEIERQCRFNEEPIIKCKDPKKNHYRNQQYDKFKIVPLASENWKNYKSVGDYFTISIYTKDFELPNDPEKSFTENEIQSEIVSILTDHNIKNMSPVQEKAIPKILAGYNTVIAGEAGCGKTLAYLVPVVSKVLNWRENKEDRFNAPFIIIITPSRELTEQIRRVIQWFQPLDIKNQKILGGYFSRKLFNPKIEDTDFLVSTVGAINKYVATGLYSLKNVRHVILDEADVLLDDSFNDVTLQFLRKFEFRPGPSKTSAGEGVQLTLVSATMPSSLSELLGEVVEVDLFEKITTVNLHKTMPHVPQKFLRVNRSTKAAYLLPIAKDCHLKKKPLIIFCNDSSTCNWLSVFLNDNKVDNICLNASLHSKLRKDRFFQFQNGNVNVLVCTSIAARGLDTTRAEHVVNYEFPLFIADYIHRCGRTGRLGSNVSGKVTNLISSKNEIELVQKIEKAVRLKREFENVNANVKRILRFKSMSPFDRQLGFDRNDQDDESDSDVERNDPANDDLVA